MSTEQQVAHAAAQTRDFHRWNFSDESPRQTYERILSDLRRKQYVLWNVPHPQVFDSAHQGGINNLLQQRDHDEELA